jgi:SET domain-containing protein
MVFTLSMLLILQIKIAFNCICLILQKKLAKGMGWGLFATRNFVPGDFVVEYFGEKLTRKQTEEREAQYELNPMLGSFIMITKHDEYYRFNFLT